MNKGEMVNEVAKVLDSKKDARAAVDAMLNAIVNTLKKGDDVSLVGFGTFKIANRKARNGRNPMTGETIKIKASKYPKFAPGKAFKDAVK